MDTQRETERERVRVDGEWEGVFVGFIRFEVEFTLLGLEAV